jgi:hypothetical protein
MITFFIGRFLINIKASNGEQLPSTCFNYRETLRGQSRKGRKQKAQSEDWA